jgi:hypothetical protein
MAQKAPQAAREALSGPSSPALLTSLERKLRAILDREMRRHVVLECLETADPYEVHAVLREMLSRAHDDQPIRALLRELLIDLLAEDDEQSPALSYPRRKALYEIALELDDESSMALLRSQPLNEATEDHVVRVPKELEELSLGMRRTLAKKDDPRWLEQLSRDPDPIVMQNLLRNPRIREEDVVRIAALRPVPESTLLEIARSARWSRQPRVRATLARNPHTPIDLSMKLIVALPLAALRAMKRDPDLHPEVQRRVEHERGQRGGQRRQE